MLSVVIETHLLRILYVYAYDWIQLIIGNCYHSATMTAFPDDRRDLAAMFVPLARALVAREEPALLAQDINADKSRIIGVLDDLQQRELIKRQPDAADRRVHLLSLTPAGDRLRRSVEAAIRRSEEEVLATLPADDREAFLRSLKSLYERYRVPASREGAA